MNLIIYKKLLQIKLPLTFTTLWSDLDIPISNYMFLILHHMAHCYYTMTKESKYQVSVDFLTLQFLFQLLSTPECLFWSPNLCSQVISWETTQVPASMRNRKLNSTSRWEVWVRHHIAALLAAQLLKGLRSSIPVFRNLPTIWVYAQEKLRQNRDTLHSCVC